MKKVIAVVVLAGIIGILGAFAVRSSAGFQAGNAAEVVLDSLVEEDYDTAFDNMHYYDKATDLDPVISYRAAREEWIGRVKQLKKNGTSLVGYKHLEVEEDDGYPVGTVDLVFMENGEEKVKKNVGLWFGKRKGKWRLGDFNYYLDETEEKWEKALSGKVG